MFVDQVLKLQAELQAAAADKVSDARLTVQRKRMCPLSSVLCVHRQKLFLRFKHYKLKFLQARVKLRLQLRPCKKHGHRVNHKGRPSQNWSPSW